MLLTEGRRWDGQEIPNMALGECEVEGCGEIAFKENCAAEGIEERMHWHGTQHVLEPEYGGSGKFGSGRLCPVHAEECRNEWRAKNPHARILGTLGGKVTSTAKAKASRRNGKLGGRPKKKQ